jgi:hypothetical protein
MHDQGEGEKCPKDFFSNLIKQEPMICTTTVRKFMKMRTGGRYGALAKAGYRVGGVE